MAARLHDQNCPAARTWPGHADVTCTCPSGQWEERSDVFDGTAIILAVFHTQAGDVRYAVERLSDGRVVVMSAGELRP